MQQLPVIVVGAGQAGLATSYYLKKSGIEHQVLEANEQVGDQWRRRWKSLRLFSPARYNGLPATPFPGKNWELGSRLEVADYLVDYVQTHRLPVRTATAVQSIRKEHDSFLVEVSDTTYLANQVVLATGAYRTPSIPTGLSASLPKGILQLHSSEYSEPNQLPPGARILVVGAGASGLQISRELAQADHQVTLCGPKVDHLPRRFLGRDVYWWLYRSGLMQAQVDGLLGRLVRGNEEGGGELVVGDDDCAIVAQYGLDRRPRLVRVSPEAVEFEDGSWQALPAAVVWCTGYQNRYPFLDIPDALDEDGNPIHDKGISPIDGLYYIGLHHMRRINSSLLGGVGADAAYIVDRLRAGQSV